MIALLLAAATGTLGSPAQWTQFRLTNSNNAVVAGSLSTRWKIKTGGAFSASPVIAGGILYIGNNAGTLYALDPASGRVRWTYHVSNALMGAPIVFGTNVIIGEGNEDSPNGSTPNHPILVGAGPSAVFAVNRTSGALVWRQTLRGSGMPTSAIQNGLLLHHDGAGYLIAVNPATGAIAYTKNLKTVASMSAIVPLSGGRFATTGIAPNEVLIGRASDGATLQQTYLAQNGSGVGDCPAVTDGRRLYCNYVMPPSGATPVQTERAGIIRAYAVDISTGKKVWDTLLEHGEVPKRNEAAIPLLARGLLFMGCSISHYMNALDPASGAIRWRLAVHGAVKGGIAELDGVLYFGDLGGYLWAVRAADGRVVGSKKTGVPFNVGSPAIAGQTLVIGGKDGTLLAMPLAAIRSAHDK